MADKKKPEEKVPTVSVYDEGTMRYKDYPAEPSNFDYFMEGFKNAATKSNLNTARELYNKRKK